MVVKKEKKKKRIILLVKSDIIKKLKKNTQILNFLKLNLYWTSFFTPFLKALINNKSVEIRDFCRFSIKTTKAKHNARDPRTGSIIYVPSKKKVFFKMSKHLKEEINKES